MAADTVQETTTKQQQTDLIANFDFSKQLLYWDLASSKWNDNGLVDNRNH